MTAGGPKASGERTESAHRRYYRGAVRGFSLLFVAIGVAVLVRTLIRGADANSAGILLGVLFVAIGGLRLWTMRRVDG